MTRERAGRPRSKSASPQRLGTALHSLIERLGIAPTLRQFDVLTCWNAAVGEQIAKVATPLRVEHGVLYVHVRSAPWRAELSMKRRQLIEKINQTVGSAVVKDIRFR